MFVTCSRVRPSSFQYCSTITNVDNASPLWNRTLRRNSHLRAACGAGDAHDLQAAGVARNLSLQATSVASIARTTECVGQYGVCDLPNYVGLENTKNFVMKPRNSPTQGKPNPSKIRLKVGFGPLFPLLRMFFFGVEIDFIHGTDHNKTNETILSANAPTVV